MFTEKFIELTNFFIVYLFLARPAGQISGYGHT
jgi:hypothetical protein